MRYLRANRDAVTALLGTILVITLVMSSIAVIGIWGIPYIENSKIRSHHDASYATFNVIDNAVEGLISSGSGASGKFNIANYVNYGSVSIDSEGDRLVVMYSYDEEYTFNVSGLVENSDKKFRITVDNGNLDSVSIYWLNDTCFLAETKVAMADGSYKNIEDTRIGDFVKSYDEQNDVLVNCKVTQIHHHTPEEMPEYYLIINGELRVTPNHKFYSNGEWICAGDLTVGDSLFCKEIGKDYLINSIERIYEKVQTYDLTVESCHNFFVNVEGVAVLVHNTPNKPPKPDLRGNITVNSPTYNYDTESENVSTYEILKNETGYAYYHYETMDEFDNSTYTGYFYNISITNFSANNSILSDITITSASTGLSLHLLEWGLVGSVSAILKRSIISQTVVRLIHLKIELIFQSLSGGIHPAIIS